MTDFPPITELIPHRPPQLLVDQVVSIELTEPPRITATKTYAAQELVGHFPGRPIVPGVYMIEGLAQALAALAALAGQKGQALLTGVDKAKFRGVVEAPATIRYEVEVTEQRFGVTWAKGKVFLGDSQVCSANLQALVLPEGAEIPRNA